MSFFTTLRRMRDLLPAALILTGLLAVSGIPRILVALKPPVAIQAGPTETLSVTGATLKFTIPQGWVTFPTVSTAARSYAKDDRRIVVRMTGGVDPAQKEAAMRRQLANLDLGGVRAAFDGSTVRTKGGLEGRSCNVLSDRGEGQCAIVGAGPVLITVISSGSPTETAEPLQPLLHSLALSLSSVNG